MFLPAAASVGIAESTTGFPAGTLDADLAATTWCAYAWPVNYGQSGNRTFFTNQAGDLVATEFSTYSGTGAGPAAGAAFVSGGLTTISGPVAIGANGQDGQRWKQVN